MRTLKGSIVQPQTTIERGQKPAAGPVSHKRKRESATNKTNMNIRNIAIIAHVDHGKTTLVDGMLKQTHTFRDNQAEMTQTTILDSNDLERERGITILAKNTSVRYHDTKINIVDTPGHADFGGEVERVLNMAEGALLIVDAAEGPLPQTKFVLKKAIKSGLKIILVINKIDKKDARPDEVLNETENLFLHLAEEAHHLDFPVIYAVGRTGKAWNHLPTKEELAQIEIEGKDDLTPLFEMILKEIPAPKVDPDKPFKMLVSSLDFDNFQGRYCIGKITSGKVAKGQTLSLVQPADEWVTRVEGIPTARNEREHWREGKLTAGPTSVSGKVDKLFVYQGLHKVEVDEAPAGEIVAITGFATAKIGQTLTDPLELTALPTITIEEPTIKIVLCPNTSPLAGKEGKFSTARQLQDRLVREKETNIGMVINENPGGAGFVVAGRGELHLAVLLETLRREGYEMEVGKPQVIIKEINGVKCEPFEELIIEIPSEFVGVVTTELGGRKAGMTDMKADDRGTTRMTYKISSRNLLGFRNSILSQTKGTGVFASITTGYEPVAQEQNRTRNGVLVATELGKASGYAINSIQDRGTLFIGPGTQVYEGMIVGENSRSDDVDVNICKEKGKTNVRSANKELGYTLTPPRDLSLEQYLDFIEEDELLEITPLSLRPRKRYLGQVDRVRAKRANG